MFTPDYSYFVEQDDAMEKSVANFEYVISSLIFYNRHIGEMTVSTILASQYIVGFIYG